MSGIASVSFLARRASQRERVRILYRRALRDTLNWAVHRHLFYPDADALRERFEVNRKVEDVETIDRLIADGEASYNKWRHPDPYIGLEFPYESLNLFPFFVLLSPRPQRIGPPIAADGAAEDEYDIRCSITVISLLATVLHHCVIAISDFTLVPVP
uniref:NADH dehydrogenase [ubiquinone] 1 beta subcomplex subunit 9 n=1 Tax=Solanum tuberosum TaxID=4113 RepID=M1A3V2_SOLTU